MTKKYPDDDTNTDKNFFYFTIIRLGSKLLLVIGLNSMSAL